VRDVFLRNHQIHLVMDLMAVDLEAILKYVG
jgi:hypothetical protein